MARSLSEALLTSLPSFWKIAKDYMDGRFKRVITTSRYWYLVLIGHCRAPLPARRVAVRLSAVRWRLRS